MANLAAYYPSKVVFRNPAVKTKPVSYTHLDVYKRQVVNKKYASEQLLKEFDQKPTMLTPDDPLFLSLIHILVAGGHEVGEVVEFQLVVTARDDGITASLDGYHVIRAVSYTHLDVYKRQVPLSTRR